MTTTKAAYLEHYLDSLETLPAELQRNFNLMRDLDSRAQDELKAVDKLSAEYLKNVHYLSAAEKTEAMEKIQKIFRKAVAYGDDKVQLAMQTYEMVDKHIRRLDADLARFEADLKDKTLNPNLTEVDAAHKKKGRKTGEKEKKKGRRAVSDDDEIPKSVRKKIKTQAVIQHERVPPKGIPPFLKQFRTLSGLMQKCKENIGSIYWGPEIGVLPASLTITHPSDVLDMPVDPNEPTYCFCHQVSYGEMIGCDNPDCPIEWFHFACVGLTSKPKGKWFCSNCSAERKKK